MRASPPTLIAALLLFGSSLATAPSSAEEAAATEMDAAETATEDPMAGFARLIGGAWHIGPFHHVYEWGVGRKTVHARTYDAEGTWSGEARWFFHPGEKVIRGYSVDAGGTFFAELTTSFDGDTLTNELRAIGADGAPSSYTGVWKFTDDDHYDWVLFAETEEGRKQTMAMRAERRKVENNGSGHQED